MGKTTGFMEYNRALPSSEKVDKRLHHFKEFILEDSSENLHNQSARCMDCGVPFCQNSCPLGNRIPEFNDAVFKGDDKKAYEILTSTNNFPEFTGRICPAPCEGSCVLGINSDPVTIEHLEKSIIEKAFSIGWVKPKIPVKQTGKIIAIIGSGPSGLACADELIEMGHQVIIFEKSDRIGGLLRYGIPDFKLEKSILDRRLNLMKQAGVIFKTNTEIGVDLSPEKLLLEYDAVVLCIGSQVPRDLKIEGRELNGIHFAMDFLSAVNKKIAGDKTLDWDLKEKNVLVIGGGDTGSDCIDNSNRMGANSIVQLEIFSKPPMTRSEDNPWPLWPMVLRSSSSHEEGAKREWCIATKRFLSEDGINVSGVETVEVSWEKDENGKYSMQEKVGSKKIIKCDYVFLAIGFIQPMLPGTLKELSLELGRHGNIADSNYHCKIDKLFVAGDARIGQSLVVNAIAEGRKVAESINDFLEENIVGQKNYSANPFAL